MPAPWLSQYSLERLLRRLVLGHLILQRRERLPQLGVAWLRVAHSRMSLRVRRRSAPHLRQAPVAAARHAIHPVPDRILAVIVLVIRFRRVERLSPDDRGDDR